MLIVTRNGSVRNQQNGVIHGIGKRSGVDEKMKQKRSTCKNCGRDIYYSDRKSGWYHVYLFAECLDKERKAIPTERGR